MFTGGIFAARNLYAGVTRAEIERGFNGFGGLTRIFFLFLSA